MIRFFLQLFIGGILFGSAVGKALDLPGFIDVLQTYQALPEKALEPIAVLIIALEGIVGIWILSGWRLRSGALVAGGINAFYAAWMTISLIRGLALTNCGCFGVFFPQPLRWYSPLEDVMLVVLCYALSRLAVSPHLDTSVSAA